MEKVVGYVPPHIEIIEVQIEKGFATRYGGGSGDSYIPDGDDVEC